MLIRRSKPTASLVPLGLALRAPRVGLFAVSALRLDEAVPHQACFPPSQPAEETSHIKLPPCSNARFHGTHTAHQALPLAPRNNCYA